MLKFSFIHAAIMLFFSFFISLCDVAPIDEAPDILQIIWPNVFILQRAHENLHKYNI